MQKITTMKLQEAKKLMDDFEIYSKRDRYWAAQFPPETEVIELEKVHALLEAQKIINTTEIAKNARDYIEGFCCTSCAPKLEELILEDFKSLNE